MEDEGIIKSSDTERENRVPPGQRLTERFPVLHAGSVPRYVCPNGRLKFQDW